MISRHVDYVVIIYNVDKNNEETIAKEHNLFYQRIELIYENGTDNIINYLDLNLK